MRPTPVTGRALVPYAWNDHHRSIHAVGTQTALSMARPCHRGKARSRRRTASLAPVNGTDQLVSRVYRFMESWGLRPSRMASARLRTAGIMSGWVKT